MNRLLLQFLVTAILVYKGKGLKIKLIPNIMNTMRFNLVSKLEDKIC